MTVRGFVEGDRDLCTIDDIASDGGTDGNLGAVDQPAGDVEANCGLQAAWLDPGGAGSKNGGFR